MRRRRPLIRIEESRTPLTNARLAALEKKLGISLPAQYRQFLLKHNGGHPNRACFHYKHLRGPYTDSEVTQFLAVTRSRTYNFEQLFQLLKVQNKWLPDNLVPIADDAFGNSVCISVAGDDRGAIYFREAELVHVDFDNLDEPDIWDGIFLIADTFDEFLRGLTDKPRDWRRSVRASRRRRKKESRQ